MTTSHDLLSDPATDPFDVAGAGRRRHRRAHRRRPPRRRPRARLRLGPDRRPHRRDARDRRQRRRPRLPRRRRRRALRQHAVGRHRRHRTRARSRLRHPHPLLRGPGRAGASCTASAPPRPPAAPTIVLTNGCGGLNPAWGPGTPVLISDHINLTGALPARGGDLRRPHRSLLAAAARRSPARSTRPWTRASTSSSAGRTTRRRPRCRWPSVIGGDLVGMSTALEAIAARQAGLEVLGISLVTNLAAGISDRRCRTPRCSRPAQAAAERCGRLLADVVAADLMAQAPSTDARASRHAAGRGPGVDDDPDPTTARRARSRSSPLRTSRRREGRRSTSPTGSPACSSSAPRACAERSAPVPTG